MERHRADLMQRLDHILEKLDRGLAYLNQYNPEIEPHHLRRMKDAYQQLREILLGVDADVELMQRMRQMWMRK